MIHQSQKFFRTRKFLLALPLLVLPFLTLAFWSLGGGRGTGNLNNEEQAGLNLELPNANLNNDALDKLGFYEKATKDSLKLKDEIQNDPYLNKTTDMIDTFPSDSIENISPAINKSTTSNMELNEEKVYNKLSQLKNVVNSRASSYEIKYSKNGAVENQNNAASLYKEEVQEADKIMEKESPGESEEDPELKQLNGMLDKIMDIQHPERVSEKIKEHSLDHKRHVYPVTTNDDQNTYLFPEKIILLNTGDTNKVNRKSTIRFYSIEDKNIGESIQNSIQAVINETQTLVSGSTVKLRLMNDIYINGILIPKGNFILVWPR